MSRKSLLSSNNKDDKEKHRRRKTPLFIFCCYTIVTLIVFGTSLGLTLGLRNTSIPITTTALTTTVTTTTTTSFIPTTTPMPVCESDLIFMTYNNEFNNNSFFLHFDPYNNTAITIGQMGYDIDFLFNTPTRDLFGIKSNLTQPGFIREGFELFSVNKNTGEAVPICMNTMDLEFNINFPFGVNDVNMLFVATKSPNASIYCINLETCVGEIVYNFTVGIGSNPIFGTVFNNELYYATSQIPDINNNLFKITIENQTQTLIGAMSGIFISLTSRQMFPYCPASLVNITYLELFYQNLFSPTTKNFVSVDPLTAATSSNGINFPPGPPDQLYGVAGDCWCNT